MRTNPVRAAGHPQDDRGRQRPPKSCRGFTLIEVLVVVAIIALIIAILLPSLKYARAHVKCTMCLTNLHDTGMAMHQYTVEYKSYYPLVPYIGSSIYWDNPGADDNLFVLWWAKLCRDVRTFTCPATRHRIRTPRKVDMVHQPNGIRFYIYCDPKSNQVRNDWEFHGQLVTEITQDPALGTLPVEEHGTSYEYMGWLGTKNVTTRINWYPFKNLNKLRNVPGEPLTVGRLKSPSTSPIMKDADEGSSQGDVVGAPPGMARNNVPEPWDNHGSLFTNYLYGDGHVKTVRP